MTEILAFLLLPAAAAVCWLGSRLHRLRKELQRERQENLRLRKMLTVGSREATAELEYMRRLRHDLRHYLQIAGSSAPSSELQAALERPMAAGGGSWVVSTLVSYYRSRAESLGFPADLQLEAGVLCEELLPDVCLVLSNLLENAVEALQREGAGWLRARCRSAQGYLSLVVGNSSSAPLKIVNGRYLSSKAEGRFGIGLATVQDIARKYGGTTEFTADGQQFRASVFLPFPAPAEVSESAAPPQSPPQWQAGAAPDGGGSSACRKSLFDTLTNFLKLQKSFKKLFDPTRKGTLTVPFHTILPSESFG